jgi:hypothetical protein
MVLITPLDIRLGWPSDATLKWLCTSFRARSVRSHESPLGCAAPWVAFTPCEQAATVDLASPEHGKNGGREGELHLTIHRDFVFV